MRHFLRLLTFTGCLAALLATTAVNARIEKTLGYTKKQSYNSALRYLRVDRRFKIVEKDQESGYLLFEYPGESGAAMTNGSIEVIERKNSVALVIQLPQVPHYHERMLAAGLLKKLKADYGISRAPKKKEPKIQAPSEEPKKSEDPKGKPPESPPSAKQ